MAERAPHTYSPSSLIRVILTLWKGQVFEESHRPSALRMPTDSVLTPEKARAPTASFPRLHVGIGAGSAVNSGLNSVPLLPPTKKNHVHLEAQNVTLFGERVFVDVIS